MNYLNPHTHDLSGDRPKGFWIARPECVTTHNPYANGKEIVDQGWRDRGEGYDHEHFEPFKDHVISNKDLPEPTFPAPIELPQYKANITISDAQTGEFVLQLDVKGSAHVVSAIITWSADAFKEDQER